MLDALGNEVTTQTPSTVAAIDTFAENFLTSKMGCGVVFGALREDPDNVMANAHAAALILLSQRPDAPAQARPFLDAAANAAQAATARERLYLGAMECWARRDMAVMSSRIAEVVATAPRDIVAVSLGVIHHTSLGQPAAMLALCDTALEASTDIGYLHGLRAFALDQCGRFEEAREEAQIAVEANRADPCAHHAMAHVMESQGDAERGAPWLEALSDCWADCHSHMYTHNWWHTALFHVDLANHARALGIFDDHVWSRDRGFAQDQMNAIALLARLSLNGVETGERWTSIADEVEPRAGDRVQPLLDLHSVYALARAGRSAAADTAVAGMRRHAARQSGPKRALWGNAAVPAAEALVAHARGHWTAAAERMERARPHLQGVGGSHAQRELFDDILIDARNRAAGPH